MGATCATAWIVGDKLHTAYVGDLRIYLIRSGRIQQLTVDHSWVQEAMDKGILTPDSGAPAPERARHPPLSGFARTARTGLPLEIVQR